MDTVKCIRFPRFRKYGIAAPALSEGESNQVPALSDADFRDMEETFGLAADMADGGWALPDGTVLDLRRGRTDNTAYRHSSVYDAFPEPVRDALRTASGLDDRRLRSDDMSPAVDLMLASGAIRYHLGPEYFYCSVETRPTPEQVDFLRGVEDAVSSMPAYAYSGIVECAGRRMSYSSPEELSRRLANDIMSCF